MPTVPELRANLHKVRQMVNEWRRRGSPEPEGAGIRAHLYAAQQMLEQALEAEKPMATRIQDLRNELERVRELERDWIIRGSPEPEGAGVRAKVAAAEASLAQAIAAPAVVEAHVESVKRAPKRARHKPPQQHSSRDVLNKETNARFWAQTGYKPGQKLDMKNPTDRAMSKVWLDIFHKVSAEDQHGHLVTTYDHPDVEQHLQDAEVAHKAAEIHLDAADHAPDPWEQTKNVEAAKTANAIAQQSAKKAASYQPPTASPKVAETAAYDAHQTAKKPPPGVIIYPKGHPVHWHPSAQPAHPHFSMPNADDGSPGEQPRRTADEMALDNAANAANNAADVHASSQGGDQIPAPAPAPGKAKSGLGKGLLIAGAAVAAVGIGIAVAKSRPAPAPRRPHARRKPPRTAPALPGLPAPTAPVPPTRVLRAMRGGR